MGAYLSSPITRKESESGGNEKLTYGASAMQGWRMQQEDAHNCIVSFEEDCSLFAVYDGHGGHEVSEYVAKKFPEFLKNIEMWSKGRYGQALEDAFLKFDELLIDASVVPELEAIAGVERDKKDEDDDEDKAKLLEEANLPLEEVLSRYGITVRFDDVDDQADGEINAGDKKQLRRLKIPSKKRKFLKNTTENVENDVEMGENLENRAAIDENSTNERLEGALEDAPRNENVGGKKAKRPNVAEFSDAKILGAVKRSADGRAKEKCDERPRENLSDDFGEEISQNLLPELNGDCDQNAEKPISSEDGACVAKKCKMTSSNKIVVEKLTNGKNDEEQNDEIGGEEFERENLKDRTCDGVGEKVCGEDVKNFVNGQIVKSEKIEKIPVNECRADDENGQGDEEEDDEYAVDEEKNDSSATEDGESQDETDEQSEDNEESDDGEEMDDESSEVDESFPVPPPDTPGVSSGTTACVALLKGATLYVANAGDSRCVLCRGGRAVDLSEDHKPEDPVEQARIEKAGGRISEDGRVNGGLNLSRALGDHFYKVNRDLPLKDQMITALPDIRVEKVLPEDRFLVLACDGIWNSMSSQSVVDFVNSRLDSGMDPVKICEEMCDGCLASTTAGDGTGCDNMTVVIVDLKKPHKINQSNFSSVQIDQSESDQNRLKPAKNGAVFGDSFEATPRIGSVPIVGQ